MIRRGKIETLTNEERKALCESALQAASEAFAKYSNFRVGAAVLGAKGVYVGANVENASYGLSLCAERAALANAIVHGERDIRAIAIAFLDAPEDAPVEETLPCGACRQWLAELAPDAEIIVYRDETHVVSLDEIFPHAFRLGSF